ncbi:hypothetical protein ACR78J_01490 [Sphingobacterium spiritivorum]|uniref:hypothetical protein n=1 Tax=Sphingobacterium spiritivorum TaxID=258 RepID=UPI003DA21599
MAKLATDITEFKVEGRKWCLSPMIDLFNGEIVTYKMSENPNFNQVKEMLQKVFLNGMSPVQYRTHSIKFNL